MRPARSLVRLVSKASGAREGWDRPLNPRRALRFDATAAVLLGVCGVISLDVALSLGSLTVESIPAAVQYAIIVVPAITFVFRRLYPLANLGAAAAHFVGIAILAPAMSPVFALQIYYALSLYSTIAWAKKRRGALILTTLMLAACALWISSEVLFGARLDQLRALPDTGPLPPAVAAIIQVSLSTATIFVAAIGAGLGSWWSARREALSRQQAVTIAHHVTELNMRQKSEERLKIARDLHDIVGHHVALMGIQLGVAQKLGATEPALADAALGKAQQSARDATSDLRLMLEALRSSVDSEYGVPVPAGGLAGMRVLVEQFTAVDLEVTVEIEGSVNDVPPPVVICAHRIVREALTNVTRHSTAKRSHVTAVVDCAGSTGSLDLRICDSGHPKPGEAGSGLGLLGMAERVSLVGGTLTYGPIDPGFEVVARFDWIQGRDG